MPDATQVPAVRRFGLFEVNFQSGELRKNGIRLRLSGQPFQILAVLIEKRGEVVTREELHSRLWPADTFVDFDHGLNNAVARIREVLDDSSDTPRYVETIPRRGYRFIAPLTELAPFVVSPPTVQSLATAEGLKYPGTAEPAIGLEKRFFTTRKIAVVSCLVALAAVAISFFIYYRGNSSVTRPIKSLAVLPLENLSGDPAQEYFADGMTEEIIGRLSMIRGLRVISHTSVMQFKQTRASIPEIAQALGADAIVEGSVMRDSGRVRVHAQLIRGATDEHFWSETYDRELGDVFTLQSDIAQSIASRVEVTITGPEQSRLLAARHISPEVYESYLLGSFANRNRKAGVEQSIAFFEDAIKRDPTFAPAYVGLAGAYHDLGSVFGGVPPDETRPKVISAARKALELDPELAEAHVLLANTYQKQWKWNEAETEYKRASELKPSDAAAHSGFAEWLLCQGRIEEALAWSKRGREIDPLGVANLTSNAFVLFHARRYDESLEVLRSVVAVQPDDSVAYWGIGYALIAKDQPEKAIPVLEKALSLSDSNPAVMGLMVRAYAHAGRHADALRVLAELIRRSQTGYVPTAAFVNAYLGLGDKDQAYVWLERAYREQSSILQLLKVHPFFDPVRSDPRFQDLLHRVGLESSR